MAESNAHIKITADTSAAERDIKKLENAIQNIEKVGAGAAAAFAGIGAAAAAMGYAIIKTLDSASELIDTANNLGIAAQSLQVMQHAGALTGVSVENLNMGLYKLNQNIGTALLQGAGGATDALKALGIPVREIAAMKADKQFEVIAAKLNEMQSPAERTALAVELFGKQGPKLLLMVENLAAAKKEMEDLGLALSDFDVAALDAAGDSLDELKGIFDSGLKKAVAEIAPLIVAIVTNIKDAIKEAGGFEVIWGRIKDAITVAMNIAVFTAAILALSRMVTFAVGLATAIRTAGVAMGIFNAIVMRNPLGLAVGAALVLAKVLGFDVTEAMSAYFGLSKGVEAATASIAEKAEVTRKKNSEQVVLSEKLNALQEKALKAFDEQISKLQESVQYEKDKIALGESQADINKMLSEEGRKLAEAHMSITAAGKQRITDSYIELENAKRLSTERQKQKDLNRSLAEAYKSDLVKSLEQVITSGKDLQVLLSQIVPTNPGQRDQYFKALQEAFTGTTSAARQANADILNLTLRGKSEEYQILANFQKAKDNLDAAYFMKSDTNLKNQFQASSMFAMQGVTLDAARAKLKYDQEIALYNLKIKLMADETAARSSFYAKQISDSDSFYLKTIGGEKAAQEAGKQHAEFDMKTTFEKTQIGIEQGALMFNALGAQNKKAFDAAKALNIASALMSTYASVTKALAAYPFPFSLIPAGAALAMGMAQVAQIRAQTYSGRALGGPVMGNTPYMVGENGPEMFTPSTSGKITRNQDLNTSGGTTNINFSIQAVDARGVDNLLMERKGMIISMVRSAINDRGQRAPL